MKRHKENTDTSPSKRLVSNILIERKLNPNPDVQILYYFRNRSENISLDDVLKEIEQDVDCQIDVHLLHLHSSFKEALKSQIKFLVVNKVSLKGVMYHGATGIGKSSLALASAYYLALMCGSSTLIRYSQREKAKADQYAGYARFLCEASNFLILDQVNSNILEPSILTSYQQDRVLQNPNALPLTIFTAGHYHPCSSWTDFAAVDGTFRFRMIDLILDEQAVKDIFKSNKLLLPQVKNIWNISKCYGYLVDMEPNLTVAVSRNDDLSDVMYGIDNLSLTKLNLQETGLVLFPTYFTRGFFKEKQYHSDTTYLEEEHLAYLGLKLSAEMEMNFGDAMLKVLKWFVCIEKKEEKDTGEKIPVPLREPGYKEMSSGNYCFAFANERNLRLILAEASKEYSDETALQVFETAYQFLLEKGSKSELNYLKGSLFEEYIMLFIKVQKEKFAFCLDMRGDALIKTYDNISFGEASTFDEMVEKIGCCCEFRHMRSIWFRLINKFKIYDYAFVKLEHNPDHDNLPLRISEINLFQVTVSAESKRKSDNIRKMSEAVGYLISKIKEYLDKGDKIESVLRVGIIASKELPIIRPIEISCSNYKWYAHVMYIKHDKFMI